MKRLRNIITFIWKEGLYDLFMHDAQLTKFGKILFGSLVGSFLLVYTIIIIVFYPLWAIMFKYEDDIGF